MTAICLIIAAFGLTAWWAQIKGVWEQNYKKNIWTEGRGNDNKVKNIK
jgi:hypothetical protein